MLKFRTAGVDPAKNVIQVHGIDDEECCGSSSAPPDSVSGVL